MSSSTLPHLDDQAISRLIDVDVVRERLDAAFLALGQGAALVHARTRSELGTLRLSSMGAAWPAEGLAAFKDYTTVAGRFNFLISLFELESGRPVATLAGEEVTRLRTAALTLSVVSRAAASHEVLALFGAGQQGRSQAETLLRRVPFREVLVVDPADAGAWCESMATQFRVPVRCAPADEAIRRASVVLTASRAKQPLFDGALLRPGTLVVAMGSSLPSGRELDDATLRRAGRIVVEWMPQSSVEAGEVVIGLANGAIDGDRLVDLPTLMARRLPLRRSDEEIVVFKSVGIALADLAAAAAAWQRWRSQR